MKLKSVLFIAIIGLSVFYSCNQNKNTETILEGQTSVLVDETLLPIIEDQKMVFESKYKATINLLAKSEAECINAFLNDSSKILVLPRKLNASENAVFKNKKISPRETPFATDGVALIQNINAKDSLVELQNVILFLQEKPSPIKGLVFDNPNSSLVNYLLAVANVKNVPAKNVFSFKNSNEVIKYISENEGIIGVVGINWINQPSAETENYLKKVTVLSVKGATSNDFVYPSQDNIASKKYPLARDLYIINCQGFEGLGMGFSSFVAGQIGQRIVLKSGLVPFKMPGRNIRIVK